MFITDKRIDAHLAERETVPESQTELADLRAIYPDPLPGTHTWEYRWEQPTPEQLAKNPRTMPKLIQGARALKLSEVKEKTNDFATLDLGSLRWLQDRHSVVMPAFDKKNPRKDDATAIREALLQHIKDGKSEAPKPATTAKNAQKAQGPVAIPTDIAEMDEQEIETQAATMGLHDEWVKLGSKNVDDKRRWLAGKRLHQLAGAV